MNNTIFKLLTLLCVSSALATEQSVDTNKINATAVQANVDSQADEVLFGPNCVQFINISNATLCVIIRVVGVDDRKPDDKGCLVVFSAEGSNLQELQNKLVTVKNLSELQQLFTEHEIKASHMILVVYEKGAQKAGQTLLTIKNEDSTPCEGLENLYKIIKIFGSHTLFDAEKHSPESIKSKMQDAGFVLEAVAT